MCLLHPLPERREGGRQGTLRPRQPGGIERNRQRRAELVRNSHLAAAPSQQENDIAIAAALRKLHTENVALKAKIEEIELNGLGITGS